jgi:hypothetical protein
MTCNMPAGDRAMPDDPEKTAILWSRSLSRESFISLVQIWNKRSLPRLAGLQRIGQCSNTTCCINKSKWLRRAVHSLAESGAWRFYPKKFQKCPPMAGFCKFAISLQVPNLATWGAKLPIVSGGHLQYSRFLETATGDRVRLALLGRQDQFMAHGASRRTASIGMVSRRGPACPAATPRDIVFWRCECLRILWPKKRRRRP